ncbi:hypothetical protein HED60_18980 [Planctomycetales bacterium ZRK34]|nr:hypothetical protein HED60_18980 [Planctomycetales bacterium ZRK34]
MTPAQLTQLDRRIGRMLDGSIEPAELAELQKTLLENPQARLRYHQYIGVHSLLHWEHAAPAQQPVQQPAPTPELATPTLQPTTPTLRRSPFRGRSRSVWYALAAAITIAVTAWFVFSNAPSQAPTPQPQPVALLTSTDSVVFADQTEAATPGSELAPGVLRLSAGTAQVMFQNGAVVDLIAPCAFELIDADHGALLDGTVYAFVPQRGRGFTISTDQFDVVDLGTEFGVSHQAGGDSQVHVFTGRVDVRLHDAIPARRLIAGQAVRIGNGSGIVGAVPLDPVRFGRMSEVVQRTDYAAASPSIRLRMAQQNPDLALLMSFDDRVDANDAESSLNIRAINAPVMSTDVSPKLGGGHSLQLASPAPGEAAQRLVVANDPRFAADTMTLSMWVKATPQQQVSQNTANMVFAHLISTIGPGAADSAGWALTQQQNTAGAYVRNDSSAAFNQCLAQTANLLNGQWHHLAIVWTADRITSYVDGTAVSDHQLLRGNGLDGGHNLVIGAQNEQGARCFNGLIDELAIYTVALDASSIADLARGVPPVSIRAASAVQSGQLDTSKEN